MNENQIALIQEKLNYTFKKPALLMAALTHSSYANEHRKDGLVSNERLEFLGDSILGFVVAELIFKHKSKSYREKSMIKRDEDEWIKVENTHTAIVSKEVWEAVQEVNRKSKEKTVDYRPPQPTLFSKMLVCPDCGNCFGNTVKKQTRKDGRVVRYVGYQCRTRTDTGKHCSWHSISELTLKQIVLTNIKAHAEQIELNESRMLCLLQERLIGTAKRRDSAKQKRDLEQALHTIELQTTKLYEDRCEGVISEDRLYELIADFEEKRNAAQSELDTLNQSENEKAAKLSDIQTWVRLIREKSAIETIEDLDRDLLEALIEKIEVGEYGVVNGEKCRDVRIYYKFVGLV